MEHENRVTDSPSKNPSRSLVLIDQHAADERVRVERFLKDLCLGFLTNLNEEGQSKQCLEMKELSPPVPILLTTHESSRLATSREVQRAFANWGIHFSDLAVMTTVDVSVDDNNNSSGYSQVLVQRIPAVVCDKVTKID